ncbi:MAG: anaerobic ribonucleoside-triphosphate reductase activating protein [Candidatus Aquicultor sp.]
MAVTGITPVGELAMNTFGVKGLLPLSMLDWEGHLVMTVFTGGCNLRCPFCHNSALVLEHESIPDITPEMIQETLAAKEGWIDGVCITGGEPTMQSNLAGLMRFIRNLGLKVKLDTNGTRPNILRELLSDGLVDAVAMDIKTGFDKYRAATAVQNQDFAERVKESIGLLSQAEKEGVLEAEFRTTVVPGFVERDDVIAIAQHLHDAGARRYFLQQFNPKTVMVANAGFIQPYTSDFLNELAQEATRLVPTYLRG